MIMGRSLSLVLATLLWACGVAPPEGDRTSDHGTLPTTANEADHGPQAIGANVVFYNTENLFDAEDDPHTNDNDFLPEGELRWTGERYAHKLEQIAKAIGMNGPHAPCLIGLAEVENRRVLEDLSRTAGLAQGAYAIVHKDSDDPRGIDVALLVSEHFGRVKAQEFLPVPLRSGVTRPILHAVVETSGNQRIHVFVNHWPSRRAGEGETRGKRMAAAQVLRSALDEVFDSGSEPYVIVMGDFNDGPSDASISRVLEGGGKSLDAGKDLVNLVALDQEDPLGSISHGGTWEYFDQIMVSRALLAARGTGHVRAISAASVKDPRLIFDHPRYGAQPDRTFSGTRYHRDGYSDHLPVVLRME